MKLRFLITVVLCGFFFFFISCAKKEPPRPKTLVQKATGDDRKEALQQRVLDFNLEGFTQKGTKTWEVTGEFAESVSENEVKLDNIVAKAYGEDAEAVITAEEGVYDKSKNNVRLEKNVKATIENSMAFAEEFADSTGALMGNARDESSKEAVKKSRIVITCDGTVEFDYEKNQVYFNTNVKVISQDGVIDADKITVNLDPDSKKLRDILAEGNVKITRGENITYSDKAMYVEAEKKIVLMGKPKLVIQQEGEFTEGFFGQ